MATIIKHDVQRLDRLISDISNASRLDAELARQDAEPVDMRQVLETVVHMVRETTPEDGPQILLDIADAKPESYFVLGHDSRLGQVFNNLIDNARSFCPKDGQVRVSLRPRDSAIEIVVEDDGPGIRPDQFERIFERFYQVDTSRSRGEGSGLGLAICKHIIEAHGGQIWAEGNSQGGGGRFMFTLLNASTDIEEVEMDRGQHDFNFKQSPTPNSENTEHADLPPEAEAIPEDGCEN